VLHLHNCLWPIDHPPTGLIKRSLLALDGWYFRRIAFACVCVSPAIQRQIETVSGSLGSIYQFRPQFYHHDFDSPPLPVPHSQKPFNIVFAGRVEHNKGVFDLLAMAEKLRGHGVTFEVCGGGSVLEKLKHSCQQRGLEDIVTIHGRLNRPQLLAVYTRAHVVIVPTRSDFSEGFAMVAAESILMGRPVICSSVVPAAELLQGSTIVVPADDVENYVKTILHLSLSAAYYDSICQGCTPLREQFLDGTEGLASVLTKVMF
jgi:glycosyltransferase involved in cell wall biosynthesis